ncbi:MAG: glycosyltransferase family 2 protein [Pseudomonadota bacterium]
MSPAASILIVNYNGGAYLQRCVAALRAQTRSDFEVILVDNDSTDESLAPLELDDRFTLIEAGENLGFAAANNLAAKHANAPWLITLNPDAFARPDWFANLMRATDRHPGVALFGSMQIMANAPSRFDGAGDEFSLWGIAYRARYGHPIETITEDYPVFGPCAAAAAYRRDVFESLGGFDARFFCYHEDVDLALRFRRLGHRAIQVHDAIVDHVGSALTGEASPFAVYHGTRNRIWTWAKSMPAGPALLLSPFMVSANLAYLIWSLFRPGRFRPTAKGLWHGLTGLPRMIRTRRSAVPPSDQRSTVGPALVRSPFAVVKRRNRWRR